MHDDDSMRKWMNIAENFEKEYTGKTVKQTQARDYDKVTVKVNDGRVSRALNRLAEDLTVLLDQIDELKESEKNAKELTRETFMKRFFDAGDEAYLRIIETDEWVMKVSKATEGGTKEIPEVDVEGFVEGLLELVGTKLAPQVNELLKKHTKIKKSNTTAKPGNVYRPQRVEKDDTVNETIRREQMMLNEMFSEMMSAIFEYASQVIKWFKTIWDREVDDLIHQTGMDKILFT